MDTVATKKAMVSAEVRSADIESRASKGWSCPWVTDMLGPANILASFA